MEYATLSADIVKSTSLSTNDTIRLKNYLQSFIDNLSQEDDNTWGRIVKGDGLELVVANPNAILRIALMLKCYVRSFEPVDDFAENFKRYGVRIAISVGKLRINDKERGILDGEAIYLSGRGLSELSENKNDIMLFISEDSSLNCIDVICTLLNVVINKATSRQCEILYYKLQKYNELKISEVLGISQSTVNQHANTACWNAIAKAVAYFENHPFNKNTNHDIVL